MLHIWIYIIFGKFEELVIWRDWHTHRMRPDLSFFLSFWRGSRRTSTAKRRKVNFKRRKHELSCQYFWLFLNGPWQDSQRSRANVKFHDSDEQSGRLLQRSQLYIQNAIISLRISAAMLLCWGISSFLHLLAAPGHVAAAFCTMPVLLKLGKQNQSSQFAGFVASDRMNYGDSTPEHGRIHYFEDDVLSRNEFDIFLSRFTP